ncbi:hypothetical protein LINPERHAP2_LOCUS4480 [Linum perenne]
MATQPSIKLCSKTMLACASLCHCGGLFAALGWSPAAES